MFNFFCREKSREFLVLCTFLVYVEIEMKYIYIVAYFDYTIHLYILYNLILQQT